MKGTTIQLVVKTETSTDPFGNPVETEELVDIHDVLVGSPSTDDVTNTLQLYGKKVEFVLGIPKAIMNDYSWSDREFIIFGKRFRTIGYPMTGEQANIPLRWGANVKVEAYG